MRTHKRERGFVLVAALALAILYFMLMELVLMDASRALGEAQRFRSRTVAAVLAENGAELAAQDIVNRGGANVVVTDSQGDVTGTLRHNGNAFEIEGTGRTKGVVPQSARVVLQGRIDPTTNAIEIDFSDHSQ